MTALAREERDEGNAVMAHAAEFAAENIGHPDTGAARLGLERCWMAVRASEPERVRFVRKTDEGHFLRVSHDDVELQHFHCLFGIETGPWLDQSLVQGAHPVGKAIGVVRHEARCFPDILQAPMIRVVRIE